jgi:excinuclease ABC subunit A
MLLAPVVRDRKGEHTKLLENLAAQGYIRARIDGEVCDLSDPPACWSCTRSTPSRWWSTASRCAMTCPAAGRIVRDGVDPLRRHRAQVVPMDGEEGVAPMTFSANFACPECGYSMSELEPRIFSFNNPAGACPTCDGLGVQQYFDPAKLIHDPEPEPGRRRHPRLGQAQLLLLPDAQIPGRALQVRPGDALGGSAAQDPGGDPARQRRTEIEFRYMNDRGDVVVRKHPFEGILHNMERRYRETESNAVREELAKYIANKSCTSCGGSRLREEARHVFVDNATCPPSPSSRSAMRWPSSKG